MLQAGTAGAIVMLHRAPNDAFLLRELELVRAVDSGPLPAAELGRRCGLSPHALERRMLALREAGIVTVARGARGGYQLRGDPTTISMLEVVELLDGPLGAAGQGAFEQAVRAAEQVLRDTTLADASADQLGSSRRSRTLEHEDNAAPDDSGDRRGAFTPREKEILRCLAEGKVYKQIAGELKLATSTVRAHLHHIYGKLGVVDRAQAGLLAIQRGWL